MAPDPSPVRLVSDGERRARLALRHHLAPSARAAAVTTVAGDIGGLHATDPATVMLAARARLGPCAAQDVEDALYGQRSLVRILGMRRTMFVVPLDLAAVVQASCARALVPGERQRFVAMLEQSGVAGDGERWLRDAEEATLAALHRLGGASAAELSAAVPALREKITVAPGKPYGGSQGVSTRVLFLLAAGGHIVRGRPAGSWTSTLYRWAPMDSWLPGGLAQLDPDEAAIELVRRWLAAFGPGTVADLKWWTGWTAARLKRALAGVQTVAVALERGATGLVLAGDEDPVAEPEPWAALLPALDPAPMGWAGREWYLREHRVALFDRSGNIGPSVWWNGRIVGGWAQRKETGGVVVRLLEDLGADARAAIEDERDELDLWLADSPSVTPRFRTPLERKLSG